MSDDIMIYWNFLDVSQRLSMKYVDIRKTENIM